ncbi:MAG: arsenate reductase (glutaredoxin) [Magnetococcales bacterium]|nr:arsenate reductase (glutaredoxin) [Magnetococcales bacterium]
MQNENVVIWHNPHCSKSRQALKLLEDHGVSPRVVRYLDAPPDAQELGRVLTALGLEPRQLMRTNEVIYKDLGLAEATLDRSQLIAAMVANPRLIERPVVLVGNRAVVGRPPEKVVDLLES